MLQLISLLKRKSKVVKKLSDDSTSAEVIAYYGGKPIELSKFNDYEQWALMHFVT